MKTYFNNYPQLKFYSQTSLGNFFPNHIVVWKSFLSNYLYICGNFGALQVTSQLDFNRGTNF